MTPRGLIWTVVAVFGLSLLVAVAIVLWESNNFTPAKLSGSWYGTSTDRKTQLWDLEQCSIFIDRNGGVDVFHPAGDAQASVRIEGRTATITFNSVAGVPIASWNATSWPTVRDKAAVAKWNRIKKVVAPAFSLGLETVRSEEEILPHLKANHPEVLKSPFDTPWVYEILSHGELRAKSDGIPQTLNRRSSR